MFYYLGVTDGISASLDTFKGLNPKPLNDAEWRTKLRSYLPPELAALRQPHSNEESAVRIIEQEFTQAFHGTKRRHHIERK
jgi:hypothetical protein